MMYCTSKSLPLKKKLIGTTLLATEKCGHSELNMWCWAGCTLSRDISAEGMSEVTPSGRTYQFLVLYGKMRIENSDEVNSLVKHAYVDI